MASRRLIGSGSWSVIAVLALCATPLPASHSHEDLHAVNDCRYLTTENPDLALDGEHLGATWFPQGDLFRPPVADMRQPRFYLSWRRVEFQGEALPGGGNQEIDAGVVGMGIDYGIWRTGKKRRCDGLQVNVLGAIFSQFNLDTESQSLINSDFIIGPSLSYRRGRFSARFRLYHQSSHLGDEFILENPEVDRVNLSFEVLDALVSYEGAWWRVYGGGGYLTGAQPELDPGILLWGFEFRSPKRRWAVSLTPVFAADFNSLEARDWETTTSVMTGIEMSNPTGTRRYRILVSYLRGFIPFGQFFNTERITNYGLTLQFDF